MTASQVIRQLMSGPVLVNFRCIALSADEDPSAVKILKEFSVEGTVSIRREPDGIGIRIHYAEPKDYIRSALFAEEAAALLPEDGEAIGQILTLIPVRNDEEESEHLQYLSGFYGYAVLEDYKQEIATFFQDGRWSAFQI